MGLENGMVTGQTGYFEPMFSDTNTETVWRNHGFDVDDKEDFKSLSTQFDEAVKNADESQIADWLNNAIDGGMLDEFSKEAYINVIVTISDVQDWHKFEDRIRNYDIRELYYILVGMWQVKRKNKLDYINFIDETFNQLDNDEAVMQYLGFEKTEVEF